MKQRILDRLSQESTWRGIIAIATGFGATIDSPSKAARSLSPMACFPFHLSQNQSHSHNAIQ